jgi:general stress protein YciG
MTDVAKLKRGFAAMSPEKQREIASKGGKAAHAMGFAHQFTSENAAEAGRKGGLKISKDREHMSRIGTLGALKIGRGGH